MVRLVATAGAAGGAVAALLPGGPARPTTPDPQLLTGTTALILAAILTYLRPPATRPIAALLATAATAWSTYLLLNDLSTGLPGPSTAVLTASATVTLIAVATNAIRPIQLSLATPLLIVLVAATVTAGLLTPQLPVRASEATPTDPPPTAQAPGDRRWTWHTPDPVHAIVPAGTGVTVAAANGQLTALDGRTGAVRWRYARPGAVIQALATTPDLATVAAAFAPGSRTTGAALLVILDAITGKVHRESIVDDLPANPTNTALPTHVSNTIQATDLRTGADLWTWTPPEGCDLPRLHSTADLVLAPIQCESGTRVVALDDRTGEQRWDLATDDQPTTSPDGELMLVGDVLLHTENGTELTTVDRQAAVETGTHPILTGDPTDEIGPEIVDPETGERTELPKVTCANPRADTTTPSAYLRLCDPDADATLVWQDLTGDGQVTRTPIDWGESTSPTARLLGTQRHALVLPAPGAIVLARAGDRKVTGYPG